MKKFVSAPQRQQSSGGPERVGNARAARHTLVYGPPAGLPFCSLSAFVFLPPAPGAFFVLTLFSLEAPSLHGWPAGRGRNLRLLPSSSRPFGRSPSWKYPPSCSHFVSCSLIVLVLAYGTACGKNGLF